MKECLWCKKEYESKRNTSKFCSISCRVMFNRKFGKSGTSRTTSQLEAIQKEFADTLSKMQELLGEAEMRRVTPVSPEVYAAAQNKANSGQYLQTYTISYPEIKAKIRAATSSHELKEAWDLAESANLAGWQIRECEKIRNDQATKIDF